MRGIMVCAVPARRAAKVRSQATHATAKCFACRQLRGFVILTNLPQAFSRFTLEDKRSLTHARSLLCTSVENAWNLATERATSQRVKFSVVSLAEHNDGRSQKPRIEPDML